MPGFLDLAADKIESEATLGRPWRSQARPKQLPPDDPRHPLADERGYSCGCGGDPGWLYWLVMSGRGFGKTLAGGQWVIEQAVGYPGSRWAVVAPTFGDCRKTCFEGSTGILRQLQPGELGQWRRNELRLDLSNGSVILGFSADQPERLRGENLFGAWCDELCSWRYMEAWYEGLIPATRDKRSQARIVITTTPRPTRLILDLVKRTDGSVHLTRASTWENADNLSPAALTELKRRYEGTRLGRQELEGDLLEDMPGALWRREDIDAARVQPGDVPGDLEQVVVAIDPAVTAGEDSDETGIIVMGRHGDHGYVLADRSMRGTPDECMKAAVRAFREFRADRVVGEVNNGGDYIGTVLRHVDPTVPYRTVRATRGKAVRAEPASVLAEQRRLHHVGDLGDLEDQLCLFVPGIGVASGHDDRLDALVWAVEALGLSGGSYLSAYSVVRCAECDTAYPEACAACPSCHPGQAPPAKRETAGAPAPAEPMTGWGQAYGAMRCPDGHTYIGRLHPGGCPKCAGGGTVQRRPVLPFAGMRR